MKTSKAQLAYLLGIAAMSHDLEGSSPKRYQSPMERSNAKRKQAAIEKREKRAARNRRLK